MSRSSICARLHRWRWPLLIGVLFGLAYLKNQYLAYREHYQHAERMRQAQPFLEASNPIRVRAGLWPITSTFQPLTYQRDVDNDELIVADLTSLWPVRRYSPHVEFKSVAFSLANNQLAWESEAIRLLQPARDTGQLYWNNNHYERIYQSLLRRYDYREADAGRNPWQIKLGDSFNFDHPGDRRLTVAQMDSVLRYWRAHGAADSMADLRVRQRHPNRR